jgi:transcriptional regulator with XRE-family HTH domain
MGEFGRRLRDRRRELGRSISETARKADISRVYLQRLEVADPDLRVSAKVLVGLSDALGTTPDDLFGQEQRSAEQEDARVERKARREESAQQQAARLAIPRALPVELLDYLEEIDADPKLAEALTALALVAPGGLSRADYRFLTSVLNYVVFPPHLPRPRSKSRRAPGEGEPDHAPD